MSGEDDEAPVIPRSWLRWEAKPDPAFVNDAPFYEDVGKSAKPPNVEAREMESDPFELASKAIDVAKMAAAIPLPTNRRPTLIGAIVTMRDNVNGLAALRDKLAAAANDIGGPAPLPKTSGFAELPAGNHALAQALDVGQRTAALLNDCDHYLTAIIAAIGTGPDLKKLLEANPEGKTGEG